MLQKDVKCVIPLLCGILIGIQFTFYYQNSVSKWFILRQKLGVKRSLEAWDTKLADQLFSEVRVLCWIMTSPENHQTKAIHIKNTWGKRCNKLLFMSSKPDADLPTIALPVDEGRNNLWDKTKSAFQFIHRNYLDDAEWFLKADDDSYIIVENLRHMLYQYRPETSLYFGHRYATPEPPHSYMAGGGYILSKAALKKLSEKILTNTSACRQDNDGAEDYELGRCLRNYAIHVDTRDELKQQTFFPAGVEEHLQINYTADYWYYQNSYYEAGRGLKCCSDKLIGLHYCEPRNMYRLEYLIYRASPFGLRRGETRLPRKFSLQQILEASDSESKSPMWKQHEIIHNIDESERY